MHIAVQAVTVDEPAVGINRRRAVRVARLGEVRVFPEWGRAALPCAVLMAPERVACAGVQGKDGATVRGGEEKVSQAVPGRDGPHVYGGAVDETGKSDVKEPAQPADIARGNRRFPPVGAAVLRVSVILKPVVATRCRAQRKRLHCATKEEQDGDAHAEPPRLRERGALNRPRGG